MEWIEHILLCHKQHHEVSSNIKFITGSSVNVTKSAGSKVHTTTWTIDFSDYSKLCFNQICFVARPLNLFSMIMADNSWWLFLVHFDRACLIPHYTSPPAVQTCIIDLNKSGKSLGATTKQLQVPKSTVQIIICKYKVAQFICLLVSLPRSERKHKLSPATER